MVSIRMRASRQTSKGKDSGIRQMHISGAEGICDEGEAGRLVDEYIRRAMEHSRGRPDRIDITIEKVMERPVLIRALQVRTLQGCSTQTARDLIRRVLRAADISVEAAESAMTIIYGDEAMRGAAVIRGGSGERIDPDRKRGIRASRLGITKPAAASLARALSRQGIHSATVVEALILASKVASCPHVMAELCVSDDPDYTTGYIATRFLGYVRIPHAKKKGERGGGRVFFVDEGADVDGVAAYLERKPVLINSISACYGVCSIDEVIGQHHI